MSTDILTMARDAAAKALRRCPPDGMSAAWAMRLADALENAPMAPPLKRNGNVSDALFAAMAHYFGVGRDDLRSSNRHRLLVSCRKVMAYLLLDTQFMARMGARRMSTVAVGRLLCRDHSTIVHYRQCVEEDRWLRGMAMMVADLVAREEE